MSQKLPSASSPPDQASSGAKRQEWPEEDFESTADECGGFYPVRLGETFEDGRFVITRKLGWGGFSSVWLARDRKEKRHVALKVLSSYASREIEAGLLGERDVLQKIASAPLHPGFQHVVHLLDEFTFESFLGRHTCFVMNVLCYNVPGLQREIDDLQFPLGFILRLTKHVLKGLEYLHDVCEVVHSDLKPANLLLMAPNLDEIVMHELSEQPSRLYEYPKVFRPKDVPIPPPMSTPLFHVAPGEEPAPLHWVIADFGHAQLQQKHLSDVVQPYALRAPEVILGLGWGPPIDIWSLGCMMYEFAAGHWLFKPETQDDISRDVVHLAQMTQRTGHDHDDAALKRYETRKKQTNLRDLLRRATAEGAKLPSIESELDEVLVYEDSPEEVVAFTRIMLSFLTLDPAQRPRAAEALLDPAFDHV